jgi:hypothetical protein
VWRSEQVRVCELSAENGSVKNANTWTVRRVALFRRDVDEFWVDHLADNTALSTWNGENCDGHQFIDDLALDVRRCLAPIFLNLVRAILAARPEWRAP